MTMFAMKYPNTIRTVSGTTTVYNDDVVLACNTSTGACTINLTEIAQNYWNTNWKLYVYDASGNAGTNNITINAGTNQTINNASSITISTNNQGVVIQILSNTKFIANYSVSPSTSTGYNTIQDEGSSLPQRTTMNFVGAGVTATDAGGKTVITINGGITQAYETVQDEGVALPQRSTMNFVGSGVTVTDAGGITIVTINGGITQAYQTIEDEGTPVTQTSTINFVGAGVSVSTVSGKTVVTIAGGGITQAYQTVQDEGVSLTQRSTMNFTGDGVTATDSGGVTVVNVPLLTILTNSALLALISGNTVVAGRFYLVTNPTNADNGVIVQGATTNSVSSSGLGLFMNADYQAVSTYSGTNLGIWSTTTMAVNIGDVVIYNNRHYSNLTGNWGTAPSGDTTNWSLLPKTTGNGYIPVADFVTYNASTNTVTYRKDNQGNEVDLYDNGAGRNTLADFQWGRSGSTYNKVKGQSVLGNVNSYCTFIGNLIENSTFTDTTPKGEAGTVYYNDIIEGSTYNVFANSGSIRNNTISGGSTFTVTTLFDVNCTFYRNIISQGGTISFTTVGVASVVNDNTVTSGGTLSATNTTNGITLTKNFVSNLGTITFAGSSTGSQIIGCEASDGNTVSLGAISSSTLYNNYKVRKGYSNWVATLDFSSILSLGTLTIPTSLAYVGVFYANNTTGSGVTYIVNSPTNHDFILTALNSNYFDFNTTAISSAVTNCILLSNSDPTNPSTVVGRTNGSDEIVLRKYGTFNGIVGFNIWR